MNATTIEEEKHEEMDPADMPDTILPRNGDAEDDDLEATEFADAVDHVEDGPTQEEEETGKKKRVVMKVAADAPWRARMWEGTAL